MGGAPHHGDGFSLPFGYGGPRAGAVCAAAVRHQKFRLRRKRRRCIFAGLWSKFLFLEGSGAGISTPAALADPLLAGAGTAAAAVVGWPRERARSASSALADIYAQACLCKLARPVTATLQAKYQQLNEQGHVSGSQLAPSQSAPTLVGKPQETGSPLRLNWAAPVQSRN